MGTRSLIYFQEKRSDGTIVIYMVIYQQFDGYLAGVGNTLMTFLKAVKMVNRFEMLCEANYTEHDIVCNVFDDVVAQFVQKHKAEVRPVDGPDWRPPFQTFYIQWRNRRVHLLCNMQC